MSSLLLLIGTYTSEGAEGIYACAFDTETGKLTTPHCKAKTPQPSYLDAHPSRRFLYAVNELSEPDGRSGGTVSAYSLDPSTGALAFINSQPSGGGAPCHVSCHPGGRWVGAANFASGTVAVFPVLEDGALGAASCVVSHAALKSPHAHSLVFSADGSSAFAADLGIDRLMIYRFDEERGILHSHEPPFLPARPGAGPRALSLVPGGRRACLVNELDSTLSLLDLDPARGAARVIDTRGTLPADWTGQNSCADVHVHPGGRFVYCSNRGHDSIAMFAIHDDTLEPIGHHPTGGRCPRSFCLDPDGGWLLAANQATHTVTSLGIDPSSGLLWSPGTTTRVPAPVCLKLVQRSASS